MSRNPTVSIGQTLYRLKIIVNLCRLINCS